jgi:hypothetical protein
MDWVESKSLWGMRPEFAEVFVGSEPFECLESSSEVVGFEEVGQVRFELFVGVVKVALDRGILDGSIHALDLSVRSGMVGFGKPLFFLRSGKGRAGRESCHGLWPNGDI